MPRATVPPGSNARYRAAADVEVVLPDRRPVPKASVVGQLKEGLLSGLVEGVTDSQGQARLEFSFDDLPDLGVSGVIGIIILAVWEDPEHGLAWSGDLKGTTGR